MALSEADLRDDFQVGTEFIQINNLQQFELPSQTHNQITKAASFSDFDAPSAEWMAPHRSQRPRAGAPTEDQYTIVFDKPEHEQQLRTGLSSYGRKGKSVKLYIGKIGIGGDAVNIQWPIGQVNF